MQGGHLVFGATPAKISSDHLLIPATKLNCFGLLKLLTDCRNKYKIRQNENLVWTLLTHQFHNSRIFLSFSQMSSPIQTTAAKTAIAAADDEALHTAIEAGAELSFDLLSDCVNKNTTADCARFLVLAGCQKGGTRILMKTTHHSSRRSIPETSL